MEDVREKCLLAFDNGDKEKVIKLLPKMQKPQNTTFCYLFLNNCTLVHFATRWGWDDVCQLLVQTYNCDPTAKDDRQSSPLHWACFYGYVRVVDYLLRLPNVTRTINDKDKDGDTPLNLAFNNTYTEVVEALLEVPSIAIDWKTESFILPYFNIFMTGNSGSGKSTLAALLVELSQNSPSQHGKVSGVKTLTAGVCHMQCDG